MLILSPTLRRLSGFANARRHHTLQTEEKPDASSKNWFKNQFYLLDRIPGLFAAHTTHSEAMQRYEKDHMVNGIIYSIIPNTSQRSDLKLRARVGPRQLEIVDAATSNDLTSPNCSTASER